MDFSTKNHVSSTGKAVIILLALNPMFPRQFHKLLATKILLRESGFHPATSKWKTIEASCFLTEVRPMCVINRIRATHVTQNWELLMPDRLQTPQGSGTYAKSSHHSTTLQFGTSTFSLLRYLHGPYDYPAPWNEEPPTPTLFIRNLLFLLPLLLLFLHHHYPLSIFRYYLTYLSPSPFCFFSFAGMYKIIMQLLLFSLSINRKSWFGFCVYIDLPWENMSFSKEPPMNKGRARRFMTLNHLCFITGPISTGRSPHVKKSSL